MPLWLVVVFALLIVMTVYQLYTGVPASIQRYTVQVRPANVVGYRLPDMVAWHLMGLYQPQDVEKLPPTRLKLRLVGVFVAMPARYSYAVIAAEDGKQKRYRLGDTVVGGAVIYKITAEGVVLQQSGRLENLLLPADKLEFLPPLMPLHQAPVED